MAPPPAAALRPPPAGESCDLVLQGRSVATFSRINVSIASAAGRRAEGSLVLDGGASRGDPVLQRWVEGSQRGAHQDVQVTCSKDDRSVMTYALHNAWASQIAYAPGARGQTSVRLTIRYEGLTVRMENG